MSKTKGKELGLNTNSILDIGAWLLDLEDQGVSEIEVNYDGSGDSGEITDISYNALNGRLITPRHSPANLENWFYELLEEVGDWYNNDGGYGTLTIEVPTGEYTIDSHIRVTNTIDDNYSGSLVEDKED